MTAGLAGRELEEYARIATQEYVHRIQREFAEYLFDESGTAVTVKRFDTDAMVEVLHELSNAGFAVDPEKDGYAPPKFVVHPADFNVLRDDLETYLRVTDSGSIKRYNSEIHADPTLDEGLGIAIHPTAVVPGPPHDFKKPYHVRHSDGVISIQVLISP